MNANQITAALQNAKATDAEHPLMKSFRLNGGLTQESLLPEDIVKVEDTIVRVEDFEADA